MRRAAILLVALALVAGACGGDDDDDTGAPRTTTSEATSTTSTTSAAPVDVHITLTEMGRFDQPLDLAFPSDGQTYVAEKTGRVRDLAGNEVLDLSGDVSTGNEQGLLGLAFSPDATRMYVYFTNTDGDSRLVEYPAGSRDGKTIFEADQPYANHNGGSLRFGPDGMLYLGLGDGGAGGDPHGNGQNPDVVLGKILRFDPAAPEDPEKYVIGVRNPWRFSFDRETDDLWVGDVGQDQWEEVDRIPAGTPAGVNLGWNLAEGTHGFHALHPPDDTLLPVYEYGHDAGQAVVGGYVYRGKKIPSLEGVYVFADTYTGVLWTLHPDGDAWTFRSLDVEVPGGLVSSFGEDLDGELWVTSLEGGVYRIDPEA